MKGLRWMAAGVGMGFGLFVGIAAAGIFFILLIIVIIAVNVSSNSSATTVTPSKPPPYVASINVTAASLPAPSESFGNYGDMGVTLVPGEKPSSNISLSFDGPSPSVLTENAIVLTAGELYQAYQENEIAADLAYKGKTIIVMGSVDKISTDIFGSPFVTLNEEGAWFGVNAYFPRGSELELAKLARGEFIAVRGIGDGYMFSATVKDCTLIRFKFSSGNQTAESK